MIKLLIHFLSFIFQLCKPVYEILSFIRHVYMLYSSGYIFTQKDSFYLKCSVPENMNKMAIILISSKQD